MTRKILAACKAVLDDVAKLRNRHLAIALFALVAAVLSPFGLNVGPDGPAIIAAIVLVGGAASVAEKALEQAQPPAPPPPPSLPPSTAAPTK